MMGSRIAVMTGFGLLAACVTPGSLAVPNSEILSSVPFVEGRIGPSDPLTFLVDTGASASAVDAAVANRLGLAAGAPTTVEGTAGTISVDTTVVPALDIGGLIVGPITPTVSDLSGSLAPAGKSTAAIIGFDVLRHYAVEFDTAGGKVRLAPKASTLLAGRRAAAVPFTLDNNIPVIEVTLRGLTTRMRIDSGASLGDGPALFANISPSFYQRLRAAEPSLQPYTHFTATGTGGTIDIPVLPAGPMTIGGKTMAEVCLIAQPATGYFARPDAIGFLGLYSLKGWRSVIVDYPSSRLLLVD